VGNVRRGQIVGARPRGALRRLGGLLALTLGFAVFVVPSASGDLAAEAPTATPEARTAPADVQEAGATTQSGEEEEAEPQRDEAPAREGTSTGAAATSAALSTTVSGPIIGTNDAVGWGSLAAQQIIQGHITWNRVEVASQTNTVASSIRDGFKVLLVVGNTADGSPLSGIAPGEWGNRVVSEMKSNPSVQLAEAGNETYLKGNVANPAQYGRMYLAAVEGLRAAGIRTPLLFNMTGDYPHGTWSAPTGWSQDSAGGGWLHDAIAAVPGLARAVLANGVAIHPYGEVGENKHDDYGVNAIAADEAIAARVLGAIPSFYVTEFGYSLNDCGRDLGACSKKEQAAKMQAAYSVMLADPHIAGIWWYQSHDDSTGHFGYMSNGNVPRPAFKTLSTIAASVGQ